MRQISVIAVLATVAIAAAPALALAQAQGARAAAHFQRFDALAYSTVAALMCKDFGYSLDEEALDNVGARAMYAAEDVGATREAARKAWEAAVERGKARLQAEIKAATSPSLDAFEAAVTQWYDKVGDRCAAIADDPQFMGAVTAPPGFDLRAAKAMLADRTLEPMGMASWQTPKITAIGDFIYEVGLCRPRLGSTRTEAMVAPFIKPPSGADAQTLRAQRFYASSYADGIADAADMPTTAEDCAALVAPAP